LNQLVSKIELDKITVIEHGQKVGRARFEARNLRQLPEGTPQTAQSPEEIKRKLEARKYQASGGRASFTAKDL